MKITVPILIYLLVINLVCNFTYASTIDAALAKRVAGNFYSGNSVNVVTNISLAFTATASDGSPAYYVFNINSNSGFVIVTADNAALPIIGYATKGHYVKSTLPPALFMWLENRKQQVSYIKAHQLAPNQAVTTQWQNLQAGQNNGLRFRANAVGPLCATTWDQGDYYNALCPGGSPTGCTATAMAQIMKYWNYPVQGTGSVTYDDTTSLGFTMDYGIQSADFLSTTYDWAAMPNTLNSANSAVATLMYQVGVSIFTDYNPLGSSANMIPYDSQAWQDPYGGYKCSQTAYAEYFGYDSASMLGLQKDSYTDDEWDSILESELNNNRPLQYGGYTDITETAGHTWVCDGYDANNMFHMNWGWSGSYDGYFSIDNLTAGGYELDTYDEVLIGIQPTPLTSTITQTPNTLVLGCPDTFTCSYTGITYKWIFATTSVPPTVTISTGSPLVATIFTLPGTYEIYVNVEPGNFEDSLSVTIQPSAMNVSLVAAPDSVCPGSAITFTASPSGYQTYDFFVNGLIEDPSDVDSFTAGLNIYTHINTYPPLNPGDSVWALAFNGRCYSNPSPVLRPFIGALPLNVSLVAAPDSVCPGGAITFTALPPGYATYDFVVNGVIEDTSTVNSFTSGNERFASLNPGDSVWVLAFSDGCYSGPSAVLYPYIGALSPNVNIAIAGGTQAMCMGTPVTLNASSTNAGNSPMYNFLVNGASVQDSPTAVYTSSNFHNADSVVCIITGSPTCAATNDTSNKVVIMVNPDPQPIISSVLDSFLSTGLFVKYQWFWNGNAISNATTSSFIASQAGNYSVFVTDTNGCTDTSTSIYVTITGMALNNLESLNLFPNPNSGSFILQSNNCVGKEFVICDILGRLQLNNYITSNQQPINLKSLPAGTYTLQLKDEPGNVIEFIVAR